MPRKVKDTNVGKEIMMRALNSIFCTKVTFTGKHRNVCMLQQKLFPWHLKRKKLKKTERKYGRKETRKKGRKRGRKKKGDVCYWPQVEFTKLVARKHLLTWELRSL